MKEQDTNKGEDAKGYLVPDKDCCWEHEAGQNSENQQPRYEKDKKNRIKDVNKTIYRKEHMNQISVFKSMVSSEVPICWHTAVCPLGWLRKESYLAMAAVIDSQDKHKNLDSKDFHINCLIYVIV